MVIDFAKQVQTLDRLKMLYLLTYADINAVGPEVWTEWKGTLLWELYVKTHTILTRGIPEGEDDLVLTGREGAVGNHLGELAAGLHRHPRHRTRDLRRRLALHRERQAGERVGGGHVR